MRVWNTDYLNGASGSLLTGAGRRCRRLAFTLIELLVVMAIIGIMMGLLFPAFNVIRSKAWDTRIRETTVQTSVAWQQFLQDYRAFPPQELLRDLRDFADESGDYKFTMSQDACNLLNWFQEPPREYDPDGDTDARLTAWYEEIIKETKRDFDWKTLPNGEVTVNHKGVKKDVSLRERYIERNERDWLVGLEGERDGRRVWVKLDTNYDGKIVYTDALSGKTEVVRAGALAWAQDTNSPARARVIKSW
jgi:prepilin-type N-terminal cleavage/methylation domain-containing protein